jgi:hypothetical protein
LREKVYDLEKFINALHCIGFGGSELNCFERTQINISRKKNSALKFKALVLAKLKKTFIGF